MPPHHVEVSKVVEIIDSILHVEEYYLDSLPQNPDQIDETSQDSWTLFLRLLAPISVFLNDGFSDGFFESSILVVAHVCSSAGRFETAIGSRVEGRFIDVCIVGGGEKAVAGEWDFGGFFGVAVRAML